MCTSKRRSSAIRSLLALVVSALLLSSCATTDAEGEDDSEGLFKKNDPQLAENHSYIVDSPHSSALEPRNWLDYSAYYLGEIVLAPFRLIQMVIDGA